MQVDDFQVLLADDNQNNAAVALDLAKRGFPVFPIRDWKDGDDWKPIKRFQEKASADPERVRAWWTDWPEAQIGLLTDARSGVTVLDLDRKNGKDGVAALAALGFCDLSALSPVRVRTPSGGWHLFFQHEPRLKNSVSKLAPGVDVKTRAGFVIAPGSVKNGLRYIPEGTPLGTVPLPAFPETLIPPPEPERDPVEIVTEATEFHRNWAEGYLNSLATDLASMPEGGRNDALNQAAMWAGGAAAHGFVTRERAEEALGVAAEAARLRKSEFRGTFKSGFTAGLAKPLTDFPHDTTDDEFDDLDDLDDDTEKAQPKTHLRFLTPADCAATPSRGYVIKGFIAPGDVGCIFGAPGAGKSLIAPHLAYAVAQGRPVFGMRTKGGRTFYVAAEDSHGMRSRINALRLRHGDAPEFVLVEPISDLLAKDSADLKALYQAVKQQKPKLVFIDTLAMAFPGLEENSADEMGRVVAISRKLASHGSAVVLIHHDTKSQGPTPRGHSLLNGALDVAMQLFPRDDEGIVRGKLTKNRNGPCDRDIAFSIATEMTGNDEDGDPVTPALVDEIKPGCAPKSVKLSASERAALKVLNALGGESGGCEESMWRETCIDGRSVSSSDNRDNRKRTFNRAMADLVRKGVIYVSNGKARVVENQTSRTPD